MNRLLLCFCALLAFLITGPILLPAAELIDPPPAEESKPFGQWLGETDRLTGDWGGVRSNWEKHGIKIDLFYNQFFGWKSRGGVVPPADNAFSGSVDFFGRVDFEKLGWIPGGNALIQVKNNWGFNINPEVGALGAPIDDADGDHVIYIDQLYYQQATPNRKLQLRIGYIDHQTIVDRNAYANSEDVQFMNTYLDNNNAIIPLTIGPGASLFLNPNEWLGFVFSMADADSQLFESNFGKFFDSDLSFHAFFETDFKYVHPTKRGPLIGNYRFGLVLDTKEREIWGTTRKSSSNLRFYLSFDQQVFNEPDQSNGQGLGLFCRYGHRDGDLNFGGNPTEHFWSVGLQYKGLFPTRDNDALGLGFYSAIASNPRRKFDPNSSDLGREDGYELYYRYQLTPAVAISPGVQYIHQPSSRVTVDDVWVLALRARFAF